MKINYTKAEALSYPEPIDSTSSKKFIYLRRNITELSRVDECTGKPFIYYEYDEAKLTKEEYQYYLKELNVENTLEMLQALQKENQILTDQVNILTDCVLEMSEIVYS